MDFTDVIDLIGVVAWPAVIVTAVLVLRKPLSSFLKGLGQRTKKLSVFQFALELSEVPEIKPTWSGPLLSDVRQPTAAAEFDSRAKALFEQFEDETAYDYAVVDLEVGNQWLTSRLFIFAVVLERMRGLRCFVFLETSGGIRRRFVGMAPPGVVRWSLATRYPWLEVAFAEAYAQIIRAEHIRSVHGALPPLSAAHLVNIFLQRIQEEQRPATHDSEWVALKDQGEQRWEHAKWLDGACLQRALGYHLQLPWMPHSQGPWVPHFPKAPADEQAKMILRREGPFVAVVEAEKVFRALIDRQALVEQVARLAAETPNEQ